MKTVPVNAERAYQVEIGVDWRRALLDWTEGRKRVVVISSEDFQVSTKFDTILIPDGEAGKSIETLSLIWQRLGELEINRDDLLIGVGGGAVTDLTGFVAATWMRGIDWIAIPTTVAGMVDAAIGGKTGINTAGGKNLVGAFHSPISVLIDTQWCKTLTDRDFAAGLAEVIKCGFIFDQEILQIIDANDFSAIRSSEPILSDLIFRSVCVKAEVVSADFKEGFDREILNYGHTLGHAVEKHANYQLRHGEAVSIGLAFMAELSYARGLISKEIHDLHFKLLNKLNLPTQYEISAWPSLLSNMFLDKKSKSGKIRLVSLSNLGTCTRIEDATSEELSDAYEKICR